MTTRAAKRAIRRTVIARIQALPPEDRARQEVSLLSALPGLPGFADADTVLLYVSAFPEEFDTGPMLRLALNQGKRLICPRVNRDEMRLDLHAVGNLDRDLEPGTLGILEPRTSTPLVEPKAVDWVLVPGVAFDIRGYRIGRGAGHYDRLLPRLRPVVPRWSLGFEEQWVETVPDEPHDQRVDGFVSPNRGVSSQEK